MTSNTYKVLAAFFAGQVVQLILHGVALNLWSYRQIPFCGAGGGIILLAIIAGAILCESERVKAEAKKKPVEKKSYKEWAEVPDVEIPDDLFRGL